MGAGNENIILLAGGAALLVLLGSIIVLVRMFGKTRRDTKLKLEKLKVRFDPKGKVATDRLRAVRGIEAESGLTKFLNNLLPKPQLIQARLERAGLKVELSRYAALCAGLGIFIMFGLVSIGSPILISVLMGLMLGMGLPHFIVGKMITKRIAKFTHQFPEALDLMVRGLKAGLPVNECIINVGKEVAAPTGTEFRRISDDMKLGKQLEQSLWETSDRLDTPDFKFFVISLAVQRETGGNLGETLGNLAMILRGRQTMKMKIKALSSEAKASAWIVGSLPFIMLGLIMSMNYEYGIVLFTHPKGIAAGIGGLLVMSLGIWIMSKMVNFEV